MHPRSQIEYNLNISKMNVFLMINQLTTLKLYSSGFANAFGNAFIAKILIFAT